MNLDCFNLVGKSDRVVVMALKNVPTFTVMGIVILVTGPIGLIDKGMKVFKTLFLTPILFLSFTTCSHSDSTEEEDVQTVYPLTMTREVSDLESFISDLKIFPLWNDSLSISGVSKLVVVDSDFVMLSGGVLYKITSFADDFPIITKIGNVGRGPGEYLTIKDFAVSLSGDEVFCLDITSDILRYSLTTGNYVGEITTEILPGCAEAIIPLEEDRLAVYLPNPVVSEMVDKDNVDFYSLHIYNCSGREVSRDMKWADFNIEASFSIPVAASSGGYNVLSPESSSPSRVYQNGKLSKLISFDFQRKGLPYRYAFRNSNNPWDSIGDIFSSDYYKLYSSVYILQDALYFRAFGKESSLWNFYMPSDGSVGIRWNSIPTLSPPISAIGADESRLFFSYDDLGLVDSEIDPLKKVVLNRFGKPDEINGSFLVMIKFLVDEK